MNNYLSTVSEVPYDMYIEFNPSSSATTCTNVNPEYTIYKIQRLSCLIT